MPCRVLQVPNHHLGGSRMAKTHIDFIQASSLRLLLERINSYNDEHPENPILKEDIVELQEREGVNILLYYK